MLLGQSAIDRSGWSYGRFVPWLLSANTRDTRPAGGLRNSRDQYVQSDAVLFRHDPVTWSWAVSIRQAKQVDDAVRPAFRQGLAQVRLSPASSWCPSRVALYLVDGPWSF